jgi:hypothetical protein
MAETLIESKGAPKMPLDIGKTYRNGWGDTHKIMGHVRHDDTLVWSLQGNHYRQSDGRYAPLGTPQEIATNDDLIDEVADEDDSQS